MHYFAKVPIAEMAKAFGVTSSRISQVHARTLHELRACLSVEREA
jgi:DNA-directed RNA polymerase specialized sigma subunit